MLFLMLVLYRVDQELLRVRLLLFTATLKSLIHEGHIVLGLLRFFRLLLTFGLRMPSRIVVAIHEKSFFHIHLDNTGVVVVLHDVVHVLEI